MNVQALGLPEPDVHWSREVREGHLSLFGQTDELHYFSGQEEPEESLPGKKLFVLLDIPIFLNLK